jgi:hypothetical protein
MAIRLPRVELIRRKVQFLSIMACSFAGDPKVEYNVAGDIPACQKVMESWPTDIYISEFAIGQQVCVSWDHLHKHLREDNPLRVGYQRFYEANVKPGEPLAATVGRVAFGG